VLLMAKARNKTCSLILFWLIFYIAAGLPLLHPMMHSHLDHGHEYPAPFVEISWATPDDENSLECPLCRFLAKNQLCTDGFHPAGSAAELDGFRVPVNLYVMSVAGSFIGQPRAPPLMTPP